MKIYIIKQKIYSFIYNLSIKIIIIKALKRKIYAKVMTKLSPSPFFVHDRRYDEFVGIRNRDSKSSQFLAEVEGFLASDEMADLVLKASALDPNVGTLIGNELGYCPHWHDMDYALLREASETIPLGDYDTIILMPAGRMGGADMVAAILARSLAETGRVLILRTDDSIWDRPDWFPDHVPTADISAPLKLIGDPRRALYVLLCELSAKKIFNVNSRLAFETFVSYGGRLADQFNLYAYYFCADRTESGIETGYPVWYFSELYNYLTASIFDNRYLADALGKRYGISPENASRFQTIYTPAQVKIPQITVAEQNVNSSQESRPCILWGGRLDRQKRFDLAIEIARAMPEVDFRCWGKSVLDAPPSMNSLPANVELNPPFSAYDDLPLTHCDGWLYTSEWDGLPTILIELGALGMPIVASAVGGVPELIDESTGWPVSEDAAVEDYVAAIRAMLSDRKERVDRAKALQARVIERHSMFNYSAMIQAI